MPTRRPPSRSSPPKRVVEFRRPSGPTTSTERIAESGSRHASRRRLLGTLQLLAGLIVIVMNAKTNLLNGSDLVLLLGLLLAGGSIWWFGVFDRGPA